MTSWHSYPRIRALGHPEIADLLLDAVMVEEKVDGSQFSFGLIDGVLRMRSKGKDMTDAPEKMFAPCIAVAQALAATLTPQWTYICEFLSKPKHNTLAYDRIPLSGLMLLDIRTGEETYALWDVRRDEATRLGLEPVPTIGLYDPGELTLDIIKKLLERPSILGGQKIEGIVIKNYNRFSPDGKVLMGKYVCEDFKEIHKGEWRAAHPTPNDIITQCIAAYRTPARWNKAIQHLVEAGRLTHTPQDIPILMAEVQRDVFEEEGAALKALLWNWALPKIRRGITAGSAEHYKQHLALLQFEQP